MVDIYGVTGKEANVKVAVGADGEVHRVLKGVLVAYEMTYYFRMLH